MASAITTDLCVIGAGSGGLAVAAGAVQMGAARRADREGQDGRRLPQLRLRAVEVADRRRQGRARRAHRRRASGSTATSRRSTSPRSTTTCKGVIAAIAPHDSEERFEGLGVKVLRAPARFTGPREVEVGGRRVRARRFVIATGSSPAVPPMPGPRRGALSHQRDDLRSHRAAGASDRDRRRADRLRAGAGAPPARRQGRRCSSVARSCPRTIRRRSRSCAGSCWPTASTCASRSQVTGVERDGNGVAVTVQAGRRRSSGSSAAICWSRPAGAPMSTGLDLEAAGRRVQRQGHHGRRPAAHHQQADLRDRRRRGRLPVHPHGGLSRRHRDPQRAVQAAGQGRHSRGAVGHLHRARARPGRADRGRGQGAAASRSRR